MNKIN